MPLAYISHPDCLLHDMGAGHPESPERLTAIEDQLIASGLDMWLRRHDAPLATREQLLRAHDAAYVDEVERRSPVEGRVLLDQGDTSMNPHSHRAALRAAGAGVLAVDLLMRGEVESAFCAVRPPGHHAERGRAMGFCIFNNVAIAALHALEAHGLSRVAIVDFDVHHGNGTEQILGGDPRVLFASTFRHPFYPYSGADVANERVVNVPLPAGTRGPAFRAAVEDRWLPALEAFRPELILVSAGFDAHREDDMGGFGLVEDDYAWVTAALKQVARRHAAGRVASCLEGGYALSALGRSVVAHLNALIE
ncbi:MAG: histone deacetylase family protein [Chromatiales bacterium]|nr:histone deacetylase family protein [Chromatiales bacterium]